MAAVESPIWHPRPERRNRNVFPESFSGNLRRIDGEANAQAIVQSARPLLLDPAAENQQWPGGI